MSLATALLSIVCFVYSVQRMVPKVSACHGKYLYSPILKQTIDAYICSHNFCLYLCTELEFSSKHHYELAKLPTTNVFVSTT